jgi:hypothetical protein
MGITMHWEGNDTDVTFDDYYLYSEITRHSVDARVAALKLQEESQLAEVRAHQVEEVKKKLDAEKP